MRCPNCGCSLPYNNTINIKKIIKTCNGCPTQWDAWDYQNNKYYIRYRFGGLSVNNLVTDQQIFYIDYGDNMDGVLSYEDLKWLTAEMFELPDCEDYDD